MGEFGAHAVITIQQLLVNIESLSL